MKLSHYTIRNLLFPLSVVMVVWAVGFYHLIIYEIDDETNDSLENYKEYIIKKVLSDENFEMEHFDIMTRYRIREVPKEKAVLHKNYFYDSTTYIEIEMEDEPVRVLRSYFKDANDKYYELEIETSTLEQEDMVETILFGLIVLYIILLFCVLIVTHIVFKKSFRPLYTMLQWLRNFHPGKSVEPFKNDTSVCEFRTLNAALIDTAERSAEVYNKQKQFVENAAHELQTPLAICLNKIELLSENPDCTEEHLKELGELYIVLSGLIKMNKSLLLISRIDNKQYLEITKVRINDVVKKLIEDLSGVYESKELQIDFAETGDLVWEMNESLASILITNLIKNAFIHNIKGGRISVTVKEKYFSIANTSTGGALDQNFLFDRFYKRTDKKESNGLGLAIVKSITRLYNINIRYSFDNGLHCFYLNS
jgi:Signal transduction histidine kinase